MKHLLIFLLVLFSCEKQECYQCKTRTQTEVNLVANGSHYLGVPEITDTSFVYCGSDPPRGLDSTIVTDGIWIARIYRKTICW